MKVAIGCDHAGLTLKNAVIEHLKQRGFEVTDCGTYDSASCHYPVFAKKVAEEVTSGSAEKGILVCGTGVGMSMAANKIKGIRAACVSDCFSAEATRAHNDANIVCFGQRVVGEGLAFKIVDTFLDTPFEGGRHQIRIDMVNDLDNK
ncbi:MAG: ribose 5-phosphate isomerase B [Clostridia bacterium]|nr:ribose 5-phosphate isomerase B [Clostridia bacterium]